MSELLAALKRWKSASAAGDCEKMDKATAEVLAATDPDMRDDARAAFGKAAGEALSADDDAGRKAALANLDRAHVKALRTVPEPAARAVAVPSVQGSFPEPVLSAARHGGAVLSVGNVAVLAGEGGIAKSALAVSIALDLAMHEAGERTMRSRLFDAPKGGPVLLAAYEDEPAVIAWRARKLASKHEASAERLQRIHVLDLAGRPLFGPAGEGGTYNARPRPLPGWRDLWGEARRIGPRLVIVDPALSAYVGEQNAAAPVREFLAALSGEAKAHECGVLMVAHSNKAARRKNDKLDPFDPGQVSGSTAWTDGVRGVLSLTWREGDDAKLGGRVLAIAKANYGPARILIDMKPVRHERRESGTGAIVGFRARGTWGDGKAKAAPGETYDGSGLD